MTFDLAQTVSDQPPAFLTNAECEEWLGSMPLANAAHAQGLFLRELNLLYRYAMPEATRFAILETLLQPLVDAQEEMAKKFAARPLPFSPPEQAALDSSLTLWQTLALCYLRCLDACLAGDPALKNEAATVAQRTLVAFADWQVCLCQGEQLPDKAYWRKLNEIFLAVERAGLVGVAVHDKVRHGKMETRPLAAFAECHMLHCANLYELPARYVIWTARWTRRWSSKVGLLDAPPEDIRNRAVPLWVDLDSDQAATYQPRPSKTGRWLETTGVRMSLTARIPLLEQGKAPADLQLGSDVTQPPASKLLNRLLTRWCKGGEPRRHERHAASGQCSFVPGLERVHFQLSGGQKFESKPKDMAALRREREEQEMFDITSGHRRNRLAAETENIHQETWNIVDDWRLVDESINGLKLSRSLREGSRIGAGTLVAVKPVQGAAFVLGNVRWVLRDDNATVTAGIQLYSGTPRHMAIKPDEKQEGKQPYKPGFILHAGELTNDLPHIVIPVGSFRIDRRLDMQIDKQVLPIRLTKLIDRGNDFELCAYALRNFSGT